MKPKHLAFLNAYLNGAKGNATQAAIQAGYSAKAAAPIGSRLLRHPEIRQALETRLKKATADADEALQHLTVIARTAAQEVKARDVIEANKLILQVAGKLHDKSSPNSRLTVNIGFLSQPEHAMPPVMPSVATIALTGEEAE